MPNTSITNFVNRIFSFICKKNQLKSNLSDNNIKIVIRKKTIIKIIYSFPTNKGMGTK